MDTSTTNPSTAILTLDTLLKKCIAETNCGPAFEAAECEGSLSQQAVNAPRTGAEQVAECVKSVRQVRPWVRYFARIVDIFLFALLVGFALGMFAPSVLNLPSSLLTVIILFVWIFQEAVLLANCGTTPGKWLFKIKVRDREGRKLKFADALNRSFGVWLKGMGAGIPLISFIALLSSRSTLKRDGVTTWDQEGGFVVTHGTIGVLRSAVIVTLLVGYAFLGSVGSALDDEENYALASNSVSSENEELLVGPQENVAAGSDHERPMMERHEVNSVDLNGLALQAEKWLEN